ncbi:antibiotic biosynthesis monooxygenase [Desulfosarcina sp.]|nr:antibiotic biosynthesis monooxygenase [Desulfosarcina sp.]
MMLTTIRMLLPQQKRGDVLRILRSFAEQSRIQHACIHSRIYADLEEENVIMFEELWRSREELERNLRSEEYRNLLLVVELALERPEIKFNFISDSTGIEAIEKAINSV